MTVEQAIQKIRDALPGKSDEEIVALLETLESPEEAAV